MHAVIVTGDRHADFQTWRQTVKNALAGNDWIGKSAVLIHGNARGVDWIASKIAGMHGWQVIAVPVSREKWNEWGHAAGPRRNRAMLDIALTLQTYDYDVRVLAFHDDIKHSKGTKNMVEQAEKAGIPVTIYHSDGSSSRDQMGLEGIA